MARKSSERTPSSYSEEVVERLLKLVASGMTIVKACESSPDFPDVCTFRRWTYDDVEGFAARFTRARELGIHAMVDETIDISDNRDNDTTTNSQGDTIPNSEWIARSRLRVDTRKWLASKIVPKIYGDRVQAEVTGKDGGPLSVSWQEAPKQD